MIAQRIYECIAMMAIGDGFLCAVRPKRHTGLWLNGPAWWQTMWRPVVDRPMLTRALGLVGIGFGYWLASREWRQAERFSPKGIGRQIASNAKAWQESSMPSASAL